MKKYLLLIVFSILFVSCQDDVKFNNPAFEGQKNGQLWRASKFEARPNATGGFSIVASLGTETLILNTIATGTQTYPLATISSNTASFSVVDGKNLENYTTSEGVGFGEIVITAFDTANQTITGTFKFSAPNENPASLAATSVGFQNGNFYKIPVKIQPLF